MWKEIFIPVDNSVPSDAAIEIGIALAKHCGAKITGMHAYDMAIHKKRFRVLMPHMKDEYQKPETKRDLSTRHNDIMGLSFTQLSESIIKVVEETTKMANVEYEGVVLKGKNADAIVSHIGFNGVDLLVMGASGQGNSVKAGGCARKIFRRIDNRDLLFIRNSNTNGKIIVGIDGSEDSYIALKKAIALSKCFGSKVMAVSIFDLNLHKVVFNNMKSVMAGEAGQVFNSEEQEKLHEEVIDTGIGKVYHENVETAKIIAAEEGSEIETIVTPGRAEEKIAELAKKENASFIVFSRLGLHKTPESDIGSVAEVLFAESPCNVLCCINSVDVKKQQKVNIENKNND